MWTTFTLGKYDILIACDSSWKAAVIIACDATMAASTETTRLGQYMPGGTELKNGFDTASGFRLM